MFTNRIRLLACAGLLGGALTVASLGSAFAAPAADAPTPTVTPAAVTTSPPVIPTVRPRRERGLIHGFLREISQLFQISQPTLVQQLKQGTSLAQLASQYGKSADDVESALATALKARLDKQVTAGKLTADQETQRLAKASPRIDKLVNANLAKYVRRIERRNHQRRQPRPTATATPTPVAQ